MQSLRAMWMTKTRRGAYEKVGRLLNPTSHAKGGWRASLRPPVSRGMAPLMVGKASPSRRRLALGVQLSWCLRECGVCLRGVGEFTLGLGCATLEVAIV